MRFPVIAGGNLVDRKQDNGECWEGRIKTYRQQDNSSWVHAGGEDNGVAQINTEGLADWSQKLDQLG